MLKVALAQLPKSINSLAFQNRLSSPEWHFGVMTTQGKATVNIDLGSSAWHHPWSHQQKQRPPQHSQRAQGHKWKLRPWVPAEGQGEDQSPSAPHPNNERSSSRANGRAQYGSPISFGNKIWMAKPLSGYWELAAPCHKVWRELKPKELGSRTISWLWKR